MLNHLNNGLNDNVYQAMDKVNNMCIYEDCKYNDIGYGCILTQGEFEQLCPHYSK